MKYHVKDIIGYEELYTIDTEGRVWSIKNKIYLKSDTIHLYPRIILSKNNIARGYAIHILIAKHFIPNPENKPLVLHKDNNKKNYNVNNLKWGTAKENTIDAVRTGVLKPIHGEKNVNSILNNKQVLEIYYAKGTQQKISNHFDISREHVKDIKNKKKWKHLLKETDNVKFKGSCGYLIFEEKTIKFKLLLKTYLKDNKRTKIAESILPYVNKPIIGYPNYLINIMGNVYSLTNKKYLKFKTTKAGYLNVGLYNNGKSKNFFVHVLVAKTFISNPENKPIVNHKKGIKTDNRVNELEWVTHKENSEHAVRIGLHKSKPGASNPNSKLTNDQVLEIYYSKLSQSELSKKFNISHQAISSIKHVNRYKNILTKDGKQLSPIKQFIKLVDKDVIKIYNSNLSEKELSKIYNVSKRTICSIKNKKTYKKILENF